MRHIVIATAAFFSAGAAAADAFDDADSNKDGYVTLIEMVRVKSDATAATFGLHDQDRDGRYNRSEFELAVTAPPPPSGRPAARPTRTSQSRSASRPRSAPRPRGGFGS